MTKTEIFDDIISIVRNDAAFCKDEPGADPKIYRAQISDGMDSERFLYIVTSYLATFGVRGHLGFRDCNRSFLPFMVKRYQDALYVVSVAANSQLRVGDRITQVDGLSVAEYSQQHKAMLYGEPAERQGDAWFTLLSFAHHVTVERAGKVMDFPITLDGEWPKEERYSCTQLDKGIVYMRLKDFADDIAIHRLYQANDALIRSSEYLIIDVRGNEGGNDSAYAPLFEYCMAENEPALQKGPFDAGMEINYTARNCDARLKQFERTLAQDIPQATRDMLSAFVAELKEHRGKGFLPFGTDESPAQPSAGTAWPRKVYVLTDENCASSGDAFVCDIRKCSKVTVIGRPTMGILDYSNCSGQFYEDYVLIYPTSRSLYLDQGIQMRRCGIPVDIHIPWTPEHCKRDVDLDTVLSIIRKNI